MIAVVFALLAAASNALASVLQRRAARSAPEEFAFRPALLWNLVRRPVWLGGIGALTAGFLLQALALGNGGLALVQPLLIAELPFTMVLVAWLSRIRLDRRTWVAVGAMTAGLAAFLSRRRLRRAATRRACWTGCSPRSSPSRRSWARSPCRER